MTQVNLLQITQLDHKKGAPEQVLRVYDLLSSVTHFRIPPPPPPSGLIAPYRRTPLLNSKTINQQHYFHFNQLMVEINSRVDKHSLCWLTTGNSPTN